MNGDPVTAVPPGGSTPVETEFVYDATGNRDEIKEDNVQVADYEVDDFNRVTFDGVYHYEYDPEGNRVAKYIDGNPPNGVLDSGDTNWTVYTWDHRNRLIQVESGTTYNATTPAPTVTVTFGYDWLNRWIATEVDYATTDDTSEYFVYGGATLPEEVAPWDRAATNLRNIGQITLRLEGNRDFADGKETADITNRYLWGAAVDQVLADEQVEWNEVAEDYDIDQILWPLGDHLGTVRDLAAVSAATGKTEIVNTRTYDACGFLINETDTGVDHLFGFTARPNQTDTGLQNNLNRWYDPEVASWINEDLIGFRGGDANLYCYCGNDPLNHVDPTGNWWGWAAAGVGAVFSSGAYVAGSLLTGQQITMGGVVGAAVGGATAGFIAGAMTGDATSLAGIAAIGMVSGAAGGTASSIARQAIDHGRVDPRQVAHEAGAGGLMGGATSVAFAGLAGAIPPSGGGPLSPAYATSAGSVKVAPTAVAADVVSAPPMSIFAPVLGPGIISAHQSREGGDDENGLADDRNALGRDTGPTAGDGASWSAGDAIENGLSIKDPQWPWRGLHPTEDHHPLMEGKSYKEFWEARGLEAEQVEAWTETLDTDIHRAITESGWWEDKLMERIARQERANGGELLNADEVMEIAEQLLDRLAEWSKWR